MFMLGGSCHSRSFELHQQKSPRVLNCTETEISRLQRLNGMGWTPQDTRTNSLLFMPVNMATLFGLLVLRMKRRALTVPTKSTALAEADTGPAASFKVRNNPNTCLSGWLAVCLSEHCKTCGLRAVAH